MDTKSKVYIIMGVSGSGKTTIGKLLSERLGISFFDGDDFHTETNKNKMKQGIPLDDNDRYEWLMAINKLAIYWLKNNKCIILACSALKEKYRELLSQNIKDSIIWIFLSGHKNLIHERLAQRKEHYMPVSLLQSQFDILEMPSESITIDTSLDTSTIIEQIMEKTTKARFGLVGLGVMGKNLARNLARSGIKLSLYNRFVHGLEEKIAQKAIDTYAELNTALGFEDLEVFVNSMEKPRKIFMMIKAGVETDIFISQIQPYLEKGDILIDGGNSHYADTKRRIQLLCEKQIDFIGVGVSGGELGALNGPSIMPSGSLEAYKKVENILTAIAAKDKNGNPCCKYIGPEGSGHFVKMVHNGIEYAEMQLIAEVYAYLRYVYRMDPIGISNLFADWNNSSLHSYLLEITIPILQKKEGEAYLIDLILDVAGNKGTGNWATSTASEIGVPAGLITAALFARYVSVLKESIQCLRQETQSNFTSPPIALNQVKAAYTAGRLINHQQGFVMLKAASEEFKWNLKLSEIANIWTNGCIIKSTLMDKIAILLKNQDELFSTHQIKKEILLLKPSLKNFCIHSIQADLPIPCHANSLDYLNALHAQYPTANIIQAQRDFFGSHSYQKKGDASHAYYHTKW